jgi:predicted Zn-dependent protease
MSVRTVVARFTSFFLVFALCAIFSFGQTSAKKVPPTDAEHKESVEQNPAPQVADAEAAIVKSDWKSAETKLDSWLTSHPEDPRALFDAGYVADAQNRVDDAAAFYKRSTVADPKSFEAHLSLGLLLARQNKADAARPALEEATKLDPGQAGPQLKARAWRALAQLDRPSQSRVGNPVLASQELLEALKLTPETPADTLLAAVLAEATGQNDAAEAAYRRLLAKDPSSIEASTALAHLLIARKAYPEAETVVRAGLSKSPDDLLLKAQLASVLAAQDKGEALPLLEELHTAHPDDPDVTRMLADLDAQAGKTAASDHLYSALLVKNPDDVDLLVIHGQNLLKQLKYGEALAAFDRATRDDPSSGDGWSGLAFAASKTGQPVVTLHALTMRSKLQPEVPSTYFLWATSYDTMHDKERAITYYHHFLDSSAGRFPDQEWQANQRLLLLEKKK